MMKNPVVAFGGGVLVAMLAMYLVMKPADPVEVEAAPAPKEAVLAKVEEPIRVELAPVEDAPVRRPASPDLEKPAPRRTPRAVPAQVAPVATASPGVAKVDARPIPPPAANSSAASSAASSNAAIVAAAAVFGNSEPDPKPVAAKPEPALVASPVAKQREAQSVTLREGTVLMVRTSALLSSETSRSGDTFAAALADPLVVDGFVLAERGAKVSGRIVEAAPAGKVRGVSRLSLEITQVTLSDGQKLTVATDPFLREGSTGRKSDAAKIGAGAAIGAALGGIFGGGKGAAIGGAAGAGAGGGAVILTRGKPVEIESESRLPFRLSRALTVTEKL